MSTSSSRRGGEGEWQNGGDVVDPSLFVSSPARVEKRGMREVDGKTVVCHRPCASGEKVAGFVSVLAEIRSRFLRLSTAIAPSPTKGKTFRGRSWG